jgi:ArsR family metal-binding transcriptional regulator
MNIVTTFANQAEFLKAKALLDAAGAPFRTLSPDPGYGAVGTAAIVIDDQDRAVFGRTGAEGIVTAGWVEFRESAQLVPAEAPPVFEDDLFAWTGLMVLQPCIADQSKLRAIARISGDLADLFPYMNTVRKDGFYNKNGPAFSFMERYRMITVNASRIAMAKVDDIVDVWRVLESLRVAFNECRLNRASIDPSFELRKKPAALEIYYRLPKTNCGRCGEKACMAFALKLWAGEQSLENCKPVLEEGHAHLKDALFEICAGLGIQKEQP